MTPLILRQSLSILLALCLSLCTFAGSPIQSVDETAIRAMVERYLAAKTDEERQRLLTEEPKLLSVETRKALVRQGSQLTTQGDLTRALNLFQLAYKVAERISDKEGMATALRLSAVIYTRRGDYALALEYCQKSLEIFESLSDKAGIAAILNNLGIIHEWQGNYAQAMENYHKSLTLKEAVGDKAGSASTLNNLGNVHKKLGDYAQAVESYQKSLRLKEALGDKAAIASTVNNIGLLHQAQGNYAGAMEQFQKAHALAEASGDKAGIASALHNIGLVYGSQDNDAEALQYYRKSLALSEALGDQKGIALSMNSIGLVHQAKGDYARAMEHFQKSLALRETLGDKNGMAYTFNYIGIIHQSQGNYVQAMDYFQKSLALSEAIGDKARIAFTLAYIGELFEKQALYTQALDCTNRAAAIARQNGNLDYLWHSQLIAGRVYLSLKQPAQARRALMDSINTIETMRAQAAGKAQDTQRFFEGMISPYHTMINLLAAQGSAAEALTYAERARARVLLDILRSGRSNVTKAMTDGEKTQERKLKDALVSLNSRISDESRRPQPDQTRLTQLTAQLEKARLEREDFQTRLYTAHPELRVKRGEAQTLTLEQAGELLTDSKTALLEYAVTGDQTFLFVLTASAATPNRLQQPVLRLYDLKIKRQELIENVQKLRQRIANNDLDYAALSSELYNLLVAPARLQLQGKTRLVIVPDDILWEVPFQALRSTKGRFLIQDAAISYAPSLTVLREIVKSRKPKSATTLLAMGNPKLAGQTISRSKNISMSGSFDPLPEAERLVKGLAQIYGAQASKVYVGTNAREEILKAESSQYRILQLATHGVINNASPLYSHVMLAESDKAQEDGLLEAWEIMEMELQADLAVLSACETARGRIGAGEGVIGLSWALFVAGCPTTVVSQWKVESSSTTELMLAFHGNLKSGASKSEAMRLAALKLMADKRYNHPFYWAAFIVVGDDN